MQKRITLSTFRKVERAEEVMLRAVMPRTAASDPEPIESRIRPRVVLRTIAGVRLVAKPLTFTLQEVAHG